MPLPILVAFESFEHVVAARVTALRGRGGRGMGARTRTADEQHGCIGLRRLALEFRQKIRVAFTAGPGVPLDHDRSRDATHPIPLRVGAYVDELGLRVALQKSTRFLG